jgi:hypothetical protein
MYAPDQLLTIAILPYFIFMVITYTLVYLQSGFRKNTKVCHRFTMTVGIIPVNFTLGSNR